MPITLTTKPARPVPGRNVELSFTGADSATNFVRLWTTAAPVGSPQRVALDELRRTASDTGRVQLFEGDSSKPFRHTFPVGGVYTLVAQEYTRGASAYGGGYDGAPDARPTETKVGGEITLTIYVGTRLACTLGTRRHGTAQLALYVWDDTVHATTVREHGEFSPAIVSPTTDRARAAAEASTIQAKLDALDGEVWSDLLDVGAMIADMIGTIGNHFLDVGVHAAEDDDNTATLSALASAAASYANPSAVHVAARAIVQAIGRHMSNRDPNGALAAAAYHTDPDLLRSVESPPGESSPALSYQALADAYLTYEDHRVDTTAHGSADAINTLTGANVSPLIDLFGEFLRLLRGDAATLPSGEHEATVGLSRGGFRKAPA